MSKLRVQTDEGQSEVKSVTVMRKRDKSIVGKPRLPLAGLAFRTRQKWIEPREGSICRASPPAILYCKMISWISSWKLDSQGDGVVDQVNHQRSRTKWWAGVCCEADEYVTFGSDATPMSAQNYRTWTSCERTVGELESMSEIRVYSLTFTVQSDPPHGMPRCFPDGACIPHSAALGSNGFARCPKQWDVEQVSKVWFRGGSSRT